MRTVVVAAEDSLVFKSVNRKDRLTGVRGLRDGKPAVLPLLRLPICRALPVLRTYDVNMTHTLPHAAYQFNNTVQDVALPSPEWQRAKMQCRIPFVMAAHA